MSLSFTRVLTDFPSGLAMAKMWTYDPDDMSSYSFNGLGDGLVLPDKPKVQFNRNSCYLSHG